MTAMLCDKDHCLPYLRGLLFASIDRHAIKATLAALDHSLIRFSRRDDITSLVKLIHDFGPGKILVAVSDNVTNLFDAHRDGSYFFNERSDDDSHAPSCL
jgi:predicted HAD superfamily phosphohydrolase YqeG